MTWLNVETRNTSSGRKRYVDGIHIVEKPHKPCCIPFEDHSILICRGKVSHVDNDMVPFIEDNYWQVAQGYIVKVNGKKLHQYVLKNKKMIDHINRNRLDNRRVNLREATPSLNCLNRGKLSSKNKKGKISKYKGVSIAGKSDKWSAILARGSTHMGLGFYETEELAAMVYNTFAYEFEKGFFSKESLASFHEEIKYNPSKYYYYQKQYNNYFVKVRFKNREHYISTSLSEKEAKEISNEISVFIKNKTLTAEILNSFILKYSKRKVISNAPRK